MTKLWICSQSATGCGDRYANAVITLSRVGWSAGQVYISGAGVVLNHPFIHSVCGKLIHKIGECGRLTTAAPFNSAPQTSGFSDSVNRKIGG